MELKRKNTQRLLVLLAPLAAVSSIAANSASAATSALSEAKVELFDFSHNPMDVLAAIDSNTYISATDGQATALATPIAKFVNKPKSPRATNSSLSQAAGTGTAYRGIAESFAGVIGYNFEIEEKKAFSFKFNALLNLATFTDTPEKEAARASGNITFQLFDTSDEENLPVLLDEFSIFGILNTVGEPDVLDVIKNEHVTFNPKKTSSTSLFGGNKESATAKTQGIFSRFFGRATKLTLLETKRNQAIVETIPEPMSAVALLFTAASMMVSGAVKRKKMRSRAE
jgi:hypothetical protein